MKLIDTKTSEEFEAEIRLATEDDLRRIHNSDEFEFDWYAERVHPIYIIKLTTGINILGVMSLQDVQHEYRMHISLIESSKSNRGRMKKIDRIVGCLIAHAVKMALIKNYNGFVSLKPKTEIVDLYRDKYGFSFYGRIMAVEGRNASLLTKRYLT